MSDTTLSIESRVRLDQTSLVGRDEPERNPFLYMQRSTYRDVTAHFTRSPGSRCTERQIRASFEETRLAIARRPKYAAQRAHHTVATCRLFMEGDGRPIVTHRTVVLIVQ